MKEVKNTKGVFVNNNQNKIEEYNSLEELRTAWNLKPVTRKTKNAVKLSEQQERFCSKHKCKACGKPMTYIGGNQMVCTNENCKGIKIEHTDNDGNILVSYETSYDLLDDLGAEIANNIFN